MHEINTVFKEGPSRKGQIMNKKQLFTLVLLLFITVVLVAPAAPAGAEASGGFFVIADFESGAPDGFVPFADSWDGSGSTTSMAMDTATMELPTVPGTAGNQVIAVQYDIAASGGWGGGPGYGGVTHDFAAAQDWSDYATFSFWFNGSSSGADHRVELKADGAGAATSNRYEYTFTDDVTGWRFFTLSWDDFTRRYDYNPGPSPDDPINLATMWGYSILLSPGASGTFDLDLVALTASATVADFESGAPDGFVPFADSWDGSGSTTFMAMDTATMELPVVPSAAGNQVIAVQYDIAASGGWGGGPGYGGVTHDFAAAQDWSDYATFSFWFNGSSSGADHRVELKADGAGAATSNRYEYTFTDDVTGWRFFNLPWDDFTRRYDYNPGPSPDDPINLAAMWGYSILLSPGASGTFDLDQVTLFGGPAAADMGVVVDDFESGLPTGYDGDGIPIGFFTVTGAGSSMTITDPLTPPAPELPAIGTPNHVLQVDVDATSWAVVIHGFENEAVDTWVPQDWSAYEGFALWVYGNNSGTDLFIDILENRKPGSTTDDAERWTVTFTDDFAGWQWFEFPFTDFVRKEVGNGAPNDGFTLDEVHGWAFGTLGTGGPRIFYLDQVSLYGEAPERPLEVTFSTSEYEVDEGAVAEVTVKLTRPLKEEDPDQVSVSYATEGGSAVAGRDYTPVAGTLTFTKGGSRELSFSVETFDNTKRDGDKHVVMRLSDPVDIALGFVTQAGLVIVDNDPLDKLLLDDFESYPYLWHAMGGATLSQLEIAAGDPLAIPGQGAYEGVLSVAAPLVVEMAIMPDNLCNSGSGVVPVAILTTGSFDATTVDHSTVTFGDAAEAHVDRKTGELRRHEEDVDGDGDIDLLFHFQYAETGFGCDPAEAYLNGQTYAGQAITSGQTPSFGRDFPLGQDWSFSDGLNFWYYGAGSGDTVTVQLKDNRVADPGPSGWSLVWSDEFDEPAGTPPNPANWTAEIGDGTRNGNPGWGNSELQYYTDSTENAATDGQGNLVITAKEADGSLQCYYGPCEYTSARLISWHKAEFAYGRIEGRIQVPFGAGLWPAFWTLGTDIGEVDWPQSGEIDTMEFVGREPYEVFGTIHGPGYSGGQSFGGTYTFDQPVSDEFHTFAVEWMPDEIIWYVDDYQYHEARPENVAPNEWVFNHPFFIIMNVAVGGNFGGPVGEDTVFPQTMKVDYVRVYQGPDTAERFESTFVDDFSGWQKVEIPFDTFVRSADQPAGAPDDGLGLNDVWGYGFELPGGSSSGSLMLDQVRLNAPLAVTVLNTNDSGPGSLRQAIEAVAVGGEITFDASLAAGTINLTSDSLALSKDVTIDGSGAPGLAVSGGGVNRVFVVDAGRTATISNLTIADGFGWDLAGGILNNGTLTLDHCTVINNTTDTESFNPDTDFWKGGGGIYNGGNAVLNLLNSTVSSNTSVKMDGGGIYGFPGSTATIVNSTINNNTAGNVGGGLRMLGNATIENSTISANEALGWYGGAFFLTDGVIDVLNSSIVGNISPPWAPEAIFVGTFGPPSATLNLTNSIVANATGGCFLAPWGAGAVAINSLGHNIGRDDTCFLTAAGDQQNTNPLVGPLAANGGPTLTHALLAGSPAIDAGDDSACPATDQRGVARPQGASCDIGSFELEP
jgi:beta-glucanase (GH16 family)